MTEMWFNNVSLYDNFIHDPFQVLTAQGAGLDEEQVDVAVNNSGLVHKIHDVMIPPVGHIWKYIQNDENLTHLTEAIEVAKISNTFRG